MLSGLTNVLGIIIYISNNNKLSKALLTDSYYGWSFYFSGVAFLLSEAMGVLIIKNQKYKVIEYFFGLARYEENFAYFLIFKTNCLPEIVPLPKIKLNQLIDKETKYHG